MYFLSILTTGLLGSFWESYFLEYFLITHSMAVFCLGKVSISFQLFHKHSQIKQLKINNNKKDNKLTFLLLFLHRNHQVNVIYNY